MFYYQLFNIQLFIQHVIYMTKVLITGGAGFIGSNFVKYMLEKYPDYEIVNLDALTYCGNLENLEDIEDNPNYAFVKGDIQDEERSTTSGSFCRSLQMRFMEALARKGISQKKVPFRQTAPILPQRQVLT